MLFTVCTQHSILPNANTQPASISEPLTPSYRSCEPIQILYIGRLLCRTCFSASFLAVPYVSPGLQTEHLSGRCSQYLVNARLLDETSIQTNKKATMVEQRCLSFLKHSEPWNKLRKIFSICSSVQCVHNHFSMPSPNSITAFISLVYYCLPLTNVLMSLFTLAYICL